MIYASGRYDRPRKRRRRITRRQRRDTSMIGRSEMSSGVDMRGPVWGLVRKPGRAGKGDCSIEHRRRVWKRIHAEALQLSTLRYLGGRKQCWATAAVYRHRKNDRVRVVVVVHMPARVEPAFLRRRTTVDTRAWDQALVTLSREVESLRREHPRADVYVVGDWNVNLRNPAFRHRIERALGLDAVHPVGGWGGIDGTHGHSRVIDWAFSNREAWCWVLPKTPASDHRPIEITTVRKGH